MLKSLFAAALLTLIASGASAETDHRAALQTLLDQFLAGAASDIQVHQRFWADDLIYTSSSGQRFGKQKILDGMRPDKDEEKSNEEKKSVEKEADSIRYRAEDTDIRLFGNTAIVAFRLIAEPAGGGSGSNTPKSQYYNTGTFINRNGQWSAVAWQATKIPDTPAP